MTRFVACVLAAAFASLSADANAQLFRRNANINIPCAIQSGLQFVECVRSGERILPCALDAGIGYARCSFVGLVANRRARGRSRRSGGGLFRQRF